MDTTPRDVLTYWFGDPDVPSEGDGAEMKRWFSGGPAVDAEIRARFGAAVAAAMAGHLDAWADTARGRLALILLLDQFTRNVHRGSPDAFAADPRARALTREGVTRGHDAQLFPIQRMFFYMPLEHSEALADHDLLQTLFDRLIADAPAHLRGKLEGYKAYADQHRDIIVRFGRYPHRNPILGRAHTPEEADFLADGGPTFGQSASDG
ncbi:MAG: DUF924 domain-containing protein [Alphaproteobacteria bacterium]|nr:DUF924 domain-containing protein [Alphaproteobacteria bacterium]